MIERRVLRFDSAQLAGLELPCFVATGAQDGPRLALLAGIHGGEYSSIAAVMRFMGELDTRELRGTITAVPVVNMPSFRARSPFVVPEDGKNLNRCFPGSYDGTFTDALARAVFDELIAPSDVLVDLHGGDMVEALEPFTLYDASPVEEAARGLAIAFGLPVRGSVGPVGRPDLGHDLECRCGRRRTCRHRRGRRLRTARGVRGAAPPRRPLECPTSPRDAPRRARSAATTGTARRPVRLAPLASRGLVGGSSRGR